MLIDALVNCMCVLERGVLGVLFLVVECRQWEMGFPPGAVVLAPTDSFFCHPRSLCIVQLVVASRFDLEAFNLLYLIPDLVVTFPVEATLWFC